eukprot:c39099_g1_i1.p1 GENE.c39099_g1_i1~~c39099_g1_i1.p1  ORF type:complete len:620 (-),score=126.35 c39099_g1_i1:13-1872(-)
MARFFLECVFHTVNILFRRALSAMAGMKKRPGAGILEAKQDLQRCFHRGDVDGAFAALDRLVGLGERPTSFRAQLLSMLAAPDERAQASDSHVRRAEELFTQQLAISSKSVPENMYSNMIRIHSQRGDTDRAMRLLEDMEASQIAPKLRTFSPLLSAYSAAANSEKCLWLREKMRTLKLDLGEDDYAVLLDCASRVSQGAEQGVVNTARDLADIIPHITSIKLEQSLLKAFAAIGWEVAYCEIPTSTGLCPVTNETLRAIDLTDADLETLRDFAERLVCETRPESAESFRVFRTWIHNCQPFDSIIDGANVAYFGQNHPRGLFSHPQINECLFACRKRFGSRSLIVLHSKWSDPNTSLWVNSQEQKKRKAKTKPPRLGAGNDAPISSSDKQEEGKPKSPERAADKKRGRSKSPEPNSGTEGGGRSSPVSSKGDESDGGRRRSSDSSDDQRDSKRKKRGNNSGGAGSELSKIQKENAELVRGWRTEKTIFEVQPNNNDDWYWLYAAIVMCQRGKRTVQVLTNDMLRDHHWRMLTPKAFVTWRQRHLTRYKVTCSGVRADNEQCSYSVQLEPPLTFSVQIQESTNRKAWYFPIQAQTNLNNDNNPATELPTKWLVCFQKSE